MTTRLTPLDYDTVAAIGLDGTGRDQDPRFPYTEANLTPAETIRLRRYRDHGIMYRVHVDIDHTGMADLIYTNYADSGVTLDDAVLDVTEQVTSTVNNGGLHTQIEYLLRHGKTEAEVRALLAARTGRAAVNFIVRSDSPQRVTFLKALCLAFNDQSPNVVSIHRTNQAAPRDLLVHSANDSGLWVSAYDAATDTVSDTSWEIPYTEILDITLY